MDDLRRAIRPLFSRTATLRPLAAAALLLMASGTATLAQTDSTDTAIDKHYGTPLDLPLTLSGSYLSAMLASTEQDYAQAAAFFQEALSADPSNGTLLEQTFLLKLANGDILEAMKYAKDMEDEKRSNFLSSLVLGADALDQGDYKTALTYLKADGSGPLSALALEISRAWTQFGEGQPDAGLKTIEDLEGPDWFKVFTATHEALLAFAAGKTDLAVEKIEEAHQADKGAIRVIDTYARILALAGQKDKALETLAEYNRILRGHPLLDRAREDIESGKNQGPHVMTAAQGMAEILYGLGSAIGQDGADDISTALLQLSMHMDPQAAFPAIALAGQFERMDQPGRAIEALKKIPSDSPLKRQAEIQIGLNFNQMDQLDEARAHLEALIAADPKDIEPMVSLGNILRAHKIYEDARQVYDKAINSIGKLEEKDWNLLYFRGICLERLGRWGEAENDFRRALALFPNQPHVLNYLGYSLVDQGLKLDEALGMIETAAKLRPKDGYIIDSLGWVYYKLGRYDDAVKELERAVALTPADPVINDHLGDAYWRVGRKLEAKFQWSHARDLDPEPEELPKIIKKIANGLQPTPGPDEARAEGTKNGG